MFMQGLIMLHLQDFYADSTSVEGLTASDISLELGGFAAEMIQIELGHWSRQDARRLATAVGSEDVRRHPPFASP